MPLEDRYGLPLSTTSDEAAAAYREGVDLMLAGWTGTAETLDRAIATDPDFALPLIARARVHAFYQQGDLARQKATLARELVTKRGTERERSHVETLALAIEGRLPEAIASTLKHIDAWPRDAVVLSLPLGAFGLFAFSGMADPARALRARRAALWRGLVVPHHVRLGDDGEWRRRPRPRRHRARLQSAPAERPCRTRGAACDVRGRLDRCGRPPRSYAGNWVMTE
ncbi:hypothetical protein ABIF91_004180 [Bradyrhizobium sp. USDA 241]